MNIYKYEGNWTEDFPHENGNYQNKCRECGNEFLGHKRRVVCKLCFSKPTIIKQIEETLSSGRVITFESFGMHLKILIRDKSGIVDEALLPFRGDHLRDEKVADCIAFQNKRIDGTLSGKPSL